MKYAEKYGVSRASRKYNKAQSYIYFWKSRWDGSVESWHQSDQNVLIITQMSIRKKKYLLSADIISVILILNCLSCGTDSESKDIPAAYISFLSFTFRVAGASLFAKMRLRAFLSKKSGLFLRLREFLTLIFLNADLPSINENVGFNKL